LLFGSPLSGNVVVGRAGDLHLGHGFLRP
jgi:hypothetical protein